MARRDLVVPDGENGNARSRVAFGLDPKLELDGAKLTSDPGPLAYRVPLKSLYF